jgi:hypothetical protein
MGQPSENKVPITFWTTRLGLRPYIRYDISDRTSGLETIRSLLDF